MERGQAIALLLILALAACSADGSGEGGGGSGNGAGSATGGVGSGGSSAHGSGGASAGSGGMTSSGSGGMTSSGSGGSTTTGGSGGATGSGSGGAGSGSGGAPAMNASLVDRITASDSPIEAGVKAGMRNWRIWESTMLRVAPVYVAPVADCSTLVCFTTGSAMSPNARVARLDASDTLAETFDLGAGLECRGLAAEPDGHFAALLWSDGDDKIYVKRYDTAGKEDFATELQNADNHPTDFGLGESRLEFGDGKYGAYYHVHSDSGHEGDTLKYVAAAGGGETTEWDWGCSHSMSNLLTFNATLTSFAAMCVTDCYPGTDGSDFASASIGGVYIDNSKKIMDVDGGCNGSVAGELGGAAAAKNGWKMVWNAHQAAAMHGQQSYDAASMNQDIAFTSIGANHTASGSVVWLTDTASVDEQDSAMAAWHPAGDDAEQYVVGWLEPPATYKLARIGADGAFLDEPADVSAKAHWGQRDDPFRVHGNGDVVWAWFDAAGATTLHFARLASGTAAQCATP